MAMAEYGIGFTSQENEITVEQLPVQGVWPEWLNGSLVRTAPSKMEVGKSHYRHWFDGLAMLHKFTFSRKSISYTCKFLESRSYVKSVIQNKIVRGEFGTDPCLDLFGKVFSFFKRPTSTDNGSVNINLLGEELTATTETPKPVAFHLDGLTTKGQIAFGGNTKGHLTTVHPHYDRKGTLYNCMIKLGPTSKYNVYSQLFKSNTRNLIASIPADKPAYMHSIGMTESYVILTEFPMVADVLKLRFGHKPFIENYTWEKERGVKIHLVEKSTGMVQSFSTASFFAFHHVNAFEEDGDILFDIVAYEDASIINELYLDHLRSNEKVLATTELWRFTIKPDEKTVSRKVISRLPIELPRINYWRVNGLPYQYVYGGGTSIKGNFIDNITKIDVTTGRSSVWRENHCYPGEPVFVERPSARSEDDGILLSIVLDTITQTSFLLILDARDLKEVARAWVPQHITFGFHGQYINNSDPEEVLKTIHR